MCGSTSSGLVPEDKGRLVTAFLESFFRRYVEYDFTADLEEKLDRISAGELEWKDVLRDFWREFIAAVNEIGDLRITQVLDALNDMLEPHIFPGKGAGGDPRACPSCARGAPQPEDRQISAPSSAAPTIPTAASRASWPIPATRARPSAADGKPLGTDPDTGLEVTLRTGRFGPYVQLGENGKEKPKRASIPKGTDPESARARPRRSRFCRSPARSACTRRPASRSWPASAASAPTSSTRANMRASARRRRCSTSASIAP